MAVDFLAGTRKADTTANIIVTTNFDVDQPASEVLDGFALDPFPTELVAVVDNERRLTEQFCHDLILYY
jgi:hypothetical protein